MNSEVFIPFCEYELLSYSTLNYNIQSSKPGDPTQAPTKAPTVPVVTAVPSLNPTLEPSVDFPSSSPSVSPSANPSFLSSGNVHVSYYDVSLEFLPDEGLKSLTPYTAGYVENIDFQLGSGGFATSGRDENVAALFDGKSQPINSFMVRV